MNQAQIRLKLLLAALIYLCSPADCQQDVGAEIAAQATNFPYYLQSPLNPQIQMQQQQQPEPKLKQRLASSGRKLAELPLGQVNAEQQMQVQVQVQGEQTLKAIPQLSPQLQLQLQPQPQPQVQSPQPVAIQEEPATTNCLYGKQYFDKIDECLTRRPYPSMGLPAFKNEDLLAESSNLGERHGCVFILNNGLFKNYQVAKYSFEGSTESQCLDGGRVKLALQFSNVTLTYLWTLRCLNRANQLLDDSTLEGAAAAQTAGDAICVGSSQNFGFTSIQLTNIDARVELATDIYKNWRLTNVSVAMQTPGFTFAQSTARSGANVSDANYSEGSNNMSSLLGANIKEFVFESLDGDELNWRYLHLFQNWSRNRMHTNFLDQYRRFLWISLQRCLSESSERLPVKLMDVFKNQKYN